MTDFRLSSLCVLCLLLVGANEVALAEVSKVTVGLQGHISAKCSLSNLAGQLNFGTSRSAAADFTIDCNTPFIYRLSAQEGVMRLQDFGSAENDARTRLPYDVRLTIPTDDGGTLNARCNSESLSATTSRERCDADSGLTIAMHKRGKILVSLRAGETPKAGIYTANLVIGLNVKE